MAIVSGDFTASQLSTAIIQADKMWADDMMKADFEANAEIVTAIRKEQNANVSILQNPEKDREVKVHWLNICDEAADDCDNDDCDIAGNELGSDSKTYGLNVCKKWDFTVDEMVWRTNDYSMEQAVAKGFLKADKILSEAIATTAMARVESFKGENKVTNGLGTVDGTETYVADNDWNERLFAYLYRVGIQNQMSNPFLLSGTNLFEDRLITLLAEADANGKGSARLFKLMRTYFDLFNIDAANAPDLKTYMINRGSIAFASKVYYGAVPTKYMQQHRYSIASRNLPNVRFDVYYTNRCSGNTMKHDFRVKAKYDFFLNPTGCDGTRTGVLSFQKGVAPV